MTEGLGRVVDIAVLSEVRGAKSQRGVSKTLRLLREEKSSLVRFTYCAPWAHVMGCAHSVQFTYLMGHGGTLGPDLVSP